METHVVTIGLHFDGPAFELHEVFRGGEAECQRLGQRITCCSDDRRRISDVSVACGPIGAWELFLATNH